MTYEVLDKPCERYHPDTCSYYHNCCDCGGNECGCNYCFTCHACDTCLGNE